MDKFRSPRRAESAAEQLQAIQAMNGVCKTKALFQL